ncbi:MAG: hypothetical protein JWQ98_1580 [Chlorobi bacterium]|nr:hypothetical protein [Chlorobiota bacterium]
MLIIPDTIYQSDTTMNMRFLRFLVAIILGIFAWLHHPYGSYSCGPSPDYDKYTISYFDSDILTDSIYRAYGASLDIDKWSYHKYEESDDNIGEWSAYFGKAVPDSDIYRVIYGYDPGMLDSVRGAIAGKRGWRFPIPSRGTG